MISTLVLKNKNKNKNNSIHLMCMAVQNSFKLYIFFNQISLVITYELIINLFYNLKINYNAISHVQCMTYKMTIIKASNKQCKQFVNYRLRILL